MKIWRLVSGILSILMVSFIIRQAYAVEFINAWEGNDDDTSGAAGVFVALGLLVSGIVSICLYKSASKGGDITLILLFALTSLIGYTNIGTFKDLIVWSSWALLCGIMAGISYSIHSQYAARHDGSYRYITQQEEAANGTGIKVCPNCHAQVNANSAYCSTCGQNLQQQKINNGGTTLTPAPPVTPAVPPTPKLSDGQQPPTPAPVEQHEVSPASPISPSSQTTAQYPPLYPQKNNNTWIWIIVAFLQLCILAAGGYFVYDKFIRDNDRSAAYDDDEEEEEDDKVVSRSTSGGRSPRARKAKTVVEEDAYEYSSVPAEAYGDYAECVDLGLSVLWSDRNIGAVSETDGGDLYGWGNTNLTLTTDLSEYPTKNPPQRISGTTYDVAQALWGGRWRMPTLAELTELKDRCSWEYVDYASEPYYLVTGPNGNSIRLPLPGYKKGNELKSAGEWGFIWSDELYAGNDQFAANLSYSKSGEVATSGYYRYGGESIRPVMDKR